MAERLRIGIVGSGGAGRGHIRRFSKNNKAKVVALYDRTRDHIGKACEEMNLRTTELVTDNWLEFLSHKMDAVSICSPDHNHADQTIDCLNNGFHVLCEKPMAASSKDAMLMLNVSRQNKRKLMIHHQMRYIPTFVASREYVCSGKIGEVFAIEASYYHDMRERSIQYDDWRVQRQSVQNIVLGGACHPLDLIQWVTGDEIVEVFAFANHKSFTDYPDVDTVYSVLRLRSGILGQMTITIGCSRPQYNPLTVLGKEGSIVNGLLLKTGCHSKVICHPSSGLFKINKWLGKLATFNGKAINYPYDHNEHEKACQSLVDGFIDCVVADKPEEPILPSESMDTIRVCEAIIESYSTGLPIEVKR